MCAPPAPHRAASAKHRRQQVFKTAGGGAFLAENGANGYSR